MLLHNEHRFCQLLNCARCFITSCVVFLYLLCSPPLLVQYIYITLDEMHAVARHLTKKGRVTIRELAANSSSLIDLEPREAGTEGAGKRPMLDFEALAAEE